VRFYRSKLTDEIGYDPAMGNSNFDPTRREGVELDGAVRIARSTDLSAQFASRRARFRGGSYAGKTVPMVPLQSLTARLVHRFSSERTLVLSSQWVSSQRITDDFSNTCAEKIPAYQIFNARLSEVIDDWTLSAAINNLTDERYFNYRTRCNPNLKSIYPEAGRTVLLTAQRRF
jgi:iron complex outermembrane receptor protein